MKTKGKKKIIIQNPYIYKLKFEIRNIYIFLIIDEVEFDS